MRAIGYLLVGLLIGASWGLKYGGLENGFVDASAKSIAEARTIATWEVLLGLYLLWRSGKQSKHGGG